MSDSCKLRPNVDIEYKYRVSISPAHISKCNCEVTKVDKIIQFFAKWSLFIKLYELCFEEIASSFDAIRIDFLGLRWNATRTASTVSSSMLGLPDLLPSKMLPVSINYLNHLLMLLVWGGSSPNSLLNLRCTAVGDFNSWYQRTHRAFCWMVNIVANLRLY